MYTRFAHAYTPEGKERQVESAAQVKGNEQRAGLDRGRETDEKDVRGREAE